MVQNENAGLLTAEVSTSAGVQSCLPDGRASPDKRCEGGQLTMAMTKSVPPLDADCLKRARRQARFTENLPNICRVPCTMVSPLSASVTLPSRTTLSTMITLPDRDSFSAQSR